MVILLPLCWWGERISMFPTYSTVSKSDEVRGIVLNHYV